MYSKIKLSKANRKLWCADRSFCVDLTPFYEGKPGPVGLMDSYYPFYGQPALIQSIRPALEAYAKTLQASSLRTLQTYLNALFTFLSQDRKNRVCISDITADLIGEHGHHLHQRNLRASNRAGLHGCGNRLLQHLHARLGSELSNLSNDGRPLRYPSVKTTSSTPISKFVPINIDHYVKRYCLQVLRNIDKNPFLEIEPESGTNVMNPAHVLYDFLQFRERRLRGELSGSWKGKAANTFPWKSLPHVTTVTSLARELGRKPGNLWCGGSDGQMWEALFPTAEEIVASVILVTLDVGWVDTAKAFTFEGRWYTTFAKDPLRPTSGEYVALTPKIRPKTGREVWSKAAHAREGGSWWALSRIQRRTQRLRAFCHTQAETFKELSDSDPANDAVRLEFERWLHLAQLSFIFCSPMGSGSAIKLDYGSWSSFLRKIPKRANFKIPEEHQASFSNITHYDLRHVVAHRTLKESGFFATQQLLGHTHSKTTMGYLASRQLKEELFATYARVTGIAFDEVNEKTVLNRAIIQERFVRNGAQLTDEERRELGAITLHGARCKDPASPPPESGSLASSRCTGGSCVRCPLAVWNWYDDLAIPLAVEEFAQLKDEAIPSAGMIEETEIVAWEVLLREIPYDLLPRLKAELARVGVTLDGVAI